MEEERILMRKCIGDNDIQASDVADHRVTQGRVWRIASGIVTNELGILQERSLHGAADDQDATGTVDVGVVQLPAGLNDCRPQVALGGVDDVVVLGVVGTGNRLNETIFQILCI